ncbi:manganese-dependent inorganic pyrophosphatase [Clostridium acetobutylicum]|uniref:Probable manganese-dependent inorganic pyrophosphatase n=2 Tax=Bacillota TaxID=1239 RepID=PPAC_CLOAB|nr:MULTISPECIES: putative manganese-dependent inorganic diphosphatase [Clostridium]Q97H75.1 RecName: Full=Probable manganese-dependent inorganic pyrophosphatase; AltName: Full=Pyrophosphate phospho-hydrolase; Short=PPase [Clostridium acetobutylicum ATCC 824]AAK80096.1 Exopolyphosphatase [Clostridium acetobutylicum ATCC 824]ADZ21189.1 putative manganese-dependent inorganic pyrophosphatase [Clostridium acetobutylicum EA 2018]AEI33867.1 putative manganese-dependent inorganic pyrophosphatase [Clost
MEDIIYITGHKNPDTDSICSAIAYSELKNKLGFNTVPGRLGNISRETEFALNYFKANAPKLLENLSSNQDIIIVDHNERAQSVDNLEDLHLLEIIDHHRIADIQTSYPIFFRNEPVGCSSTIIGSMYFEKGIEPSKRAAGLMCSAIISDTLLFRSPTTTARDKEVLKKLAKIADIDPEKYASEMFKAGTSLKGKTVEEIFNSDYKAFNLGDKKIGVSQVTTMDIEGFDEYKKDMLAYMNKKVKDENFNAVLLLLTDIIKEGSLIIATGENTDLVNKAFNVELKDNAVYVPGILSRKKQVIPPLTSAIEGK